jgi:hypothetical protein
MSLPYNTAYFLLPYNTAYTTQHIQHSIYSILPLTICLYHTTQHTYQKAARLHLCSSVREALRICVSSYYMCVLLLYMCPLYHTTQHTYQKAVREALQRAGLGLQQSPEGLVQFGI